MHVFKIAGIYYCVDISIVILLAFSSDLTLFLSVTVLDKLTAGTVVLHIIIFYSIFIVVAARYKRENRLRTGHLYILTVGFVCYESVVQDAVALHD